MSARELRGLGRRASGGLAAGLGALLFEKGRENRLRRGQVRLSVTTKPPPAQTFDFPTSVIDFGTVCGSFRLAAARVVADYLTGITTLYRPSSAATTSPAS